MSTRMLPLALAGFALWAAPADAADRLAVPVNGAAGGPCTTDAPCTLPAAVSAAANGDTIVVAAGHYALTQPLSAGTNVDVRGADGGPRPVIDIAGPVAGLQLTAGDARHLEVHLEGGANKAALQLRFRGSAEDMIATASGTSTTACNVDQGLFRNMVCVATGAGGRAFTVNAQYVADPRAVVRNVTALAPADGTALQTVVDEGRDAHVTVVNSILRGGRMDVSARGAKNTDIPTTINTTTSSYATTEQVGDGLTAITGSPQAAAPLLTDDGHQRAGSPTVDAGTDDDVNGPLDVDGDARRLGAHTDIGADEAVPAAVAPSPTPTPAVTVAPVLTATPVPTGTPTPTPTPATKPFSARLSRRGHRVTVLVHLAIAGRVGVEVTRGHRRVAARKRSLAAGQSRLTLPRLPRGRFVVTVTAAGAAPVRLPVRIR